MGKSSRKSGGEERRKRRAAEAVVQGIQSVGCEAELVDILNCRRAVEWKKLHGRSYINPRCAARANGLR